VRWEGSGDCPALKEWLTRHLCSSTIEQISAWWHICTSHLQGLQRLATLQHLVTSTLIQLDEVGYRAETYPWINANWLQRIEASRQSMIDFDAFCQSKSITCWSLSAICIGSRIPPAHCSIRLPYRTVEGGVRCKKPGLFPFRLKNSERQRLQIFLSMSASENECVEET